ncbi:hypothetical protein Ddye_013343 [Dipteronia dyeriana]|uniref:Integrase catalytic domain-containing protein n=1 Tax=Dipteronia dyeriana TaxID=168575 RepID=A0AAE0CJI0_9ROSI|nr:hypothetical protein Ddye_013343 [Dipteronia dyeriana]
MIQGLRGPIRLRGPSGSEAAHCMAGHGLGMAHCFIRPADLHPQPILRPVPRHRSKVVHTKFDKRIKSLHTDMRGGYIAFTSHLVKQGIQVRYPCPHTHQQNGMAERKHRHIKETSLTLLAHAKIPLKFWYEAFTTATYLINNMLLVAFHYVLPFK